MGLLVCPDCRGQLSSSVPQCPWCGRKKPRSSAAALLAVLLLVALGAVFAAKACGAQMERDAGRGSH